MNAFPLRPLVAAHSPKKQQKVTREALFRLRDVKNKGASCDIYENKGTGKRRSIKRGFLHGERLGFENFEKSRLCFGASTRRSSDNLLLAAWAGAIE